MFTKAVEYVRVFENNRNSSYIKNNTKSTCFIRSSSDIEEIKAISATKVTSASNALKLHRRLVDYAATVGVIIILKIVPIGV